MKKLLIFALVLTFIVSFIGCKKQDASPLYSDFLTDVSFALQ